MTFTLLALETSSSRCGVALLRADSGGATVTVREHEGTQEHAERLLPMVESLLDDAGLARRDLDAVAFGQGPGGFTGLRVACGVSQGLGFALDVPVIPVVSHLGVASQTGAQPGQLVVVALDARMEEVYLAAYRLADDGQAWRTLLAPVLIPAAAVVPWISPQIDGWQDGDAAGVLVAGDAWEAYTSAMPAPSAWLRDAALKPDVRAVARLAHQAWLRGEALAPELAAPLYVRDKVAFTTAERLQGGGGNPRAVAPALVTAMAGDDLEAVAAIERSVQAFPWTQGNFTDALKSGYDAWVVRDAAGVAGFYIAMLAPDVSHLLVLAVRPDVQGRGLGRHLVAHCAERAQAAGLDALVLEVRPSNVRARAFYREQGFDQIGVRRAYYPAGRGEREDALVLRKALPVRSAA